MAIVSVLLALASYQLVERYIAEQNQVVQQQEQEDLVEILVSSIDLEIGSTLDPMSMVIRSYPSAYVQEDWLRPKDAGLIAGLTTTKFIERGEPLTPYAIAPDYSGYFRILWLRVLCDNCGNFAGTIAQRAVNYWR